MPSINDVDRVAPQKSSNARNYSKNLNEDSIYQWALPKHEERKAECGKNHSPESYGRVNSDELIHSKNKMDAPSQGLSTSPSFICGVLALVNIFYGDDPAKTIWTEAFVFIIMTTATLYLLQIPWKLFIKSRSKMPGWRIFFILLIFTTPLTAAYCIHVSKICFGAKSRIFMHINIPVFLLAAYLGPIRYIFSCKNFDETFKCDNCRYYVDEFEQRVSFMEKEMSIQSKILTKIAKSSAFEMKAMDNVKELERRMDFLEACLSIQSSKT